MTMIDFDLKGSLVTACKGYGTDTGLIGGLAINSTVQRLEKFLKVKNSK